MRKLLPLMQEMQQNRNPYGTTYTTDYGSLCKNVFFDVYKDNMDASQKVFMTLRPGLGTQSVINPAAVSTSSCICADYKLDPVINGNSFAVYTDGTNANTKFYYNNAAVAKPGGWTGFGYGHHIIALSGVASVYGGSYWAFTNYKEGAVVSAVGAVTQITDADYTAWTTKTNMVAMDGYIFQADSSTGYIYNSDLNTPTSWTATGRILSSLHPGPIMKLVRFRKYLVAFKQRSIEFFENTGQPTPGSPLTAAPDLCRRYGTAAAGWVVEMSDSVVWAGFDPAGRPGIFKLKYDTFEIEELSNSFIAQLMSMDPSLAGLGFNTLYPSMQSLTYKASCLTFRDKELFCIPLYLNAGTKVATYVYDMKLKTWGMWTTSASGTEAPFPATNVVRVYSGATNYIMVNGPGAGLTTEYQFSEFSDQNYFDITAAIDFKWISDVHDFGTHKRKFMNSFEVLYDIGSYTPSVPPTITFYYYDSGDASDATTSRVSSTLTGTNKIRAIWRRLGSFRQRKFVLKGFAYAPMRIGAIEVDLSMAEDDID